MASIDIEVAGRRYNVACRDGEEAHLRSVAAMVDRRARDAGDALGSLSETRLLLFAALLLADDVKEGAGPPPEPAAEDTQVAEALEALAERIEALADAADSAPTKPA